MSSDELVKTLYQISNSFNNESVWPFIRSMASIGLLIFFVGLYAYLTIMENNIRRINNDKRRN